MKKELGQFFTPLEIVDEMINLVGDITGKKICDNSCGNGNFLIKIVEKLRMIHIDDSSFLESLNNVYGFDIDVDVIDEATIRLNEFIYPLEFKWNIYNLDFLTNYKNYNEYFDIVIGNPPYIVSENMNASHRDILSNMDFSSKGMKDLYIAFFEMSIATLKVDGIGCLLTPNTYAKTKSGESLRNWFSVNNTLELFDNRKESIDFGDASTYTAISLFNKTKRTSMTYKDEITSLVVDLSEFINKPWYFGTSYSNKINDYIEVKVGIQTGANNIFIHKDNSDSDSDYIYINEFKIEKAITKRIIKASKFHNKNNEIVIFPYIKVDNRYDLMDETYLIETFPYAYEFLLSKKDELLKRDKMRNWYSFTREQGFDFEGSKIIAPLISKEPNFALCDDTEAVVYGGYYLRGINILDSDLIRLLNSKYMSEYVYFMASDLRGGYKQYTKHVIMGVTFEFDF